MKKYNYIVIILVLLISINISAQVGIGSTNPDASSMLDIQSTAKGVLIPRMTTAQREAISVPATGLLVFDNTTQSFWFYTGAWQELVNGSSGGDEIIDADADTKVEVEKTADLDEINFTTSSAERMKIDANGVIFMGDSINGNYTKVTTDGSLSYEGNATRWDDLRVPVTSLKDKGIKIPDWDIFKDDGGSSAGVYTFWFDKSTEEELFFTIQMPHAWKEGSILKPHLHWVAKTTGSGLVGWGLEYVWTNVNEIFPTNTSTVYGESVAGGDTSVVANKHYITPMSDIDATGKTLSSMLVCRIFRDASGIGTSDVYGNDAGMLQFDFHFEIDSDGSNEQFTKH